MTDSKTKPALPQATIYKPKVGHLASVGGCVGEVVEVTEEHVIVTGTYYYSDSHQNDWEDDWAFRYRVKDLANVEHCQVHRLTEVIRWNYEGVKHETAQSWGRLGAGRVYEFSGDVLISTILEMYFKLAAGMPEYDLTFKVEGEELVIWREPKKRIMYGSWA